MTDTTGVELELVRPTAVLPLSPDEARRAMATYQELSQALLQPSDVQVIKTRSGTSTFPKRSALQKLANAYRVSTHIVSREVTHDDTGAIVRCDAIVRATHPDGRYAEGDGACSTSEDRFSRNSEKIDHDLPATAVTRATNRAISNLVAFGAVSAEEAQATDEPTPVAGTPAWARHVDDVAEVAQTLTDLLTAIGVQDAGRVVAKIGQSIFDECDNGIPVCVARVIDSITAAAKAPLVEGPVVDAEPTSDGDTPEPTTETQEAA